MKRIVSVLMAAAVLATAGCMTAKKTTITANPNGTFTTNTVTVVNEPNLALDCVIISGATATAVNTVLIQTKHDPNVVAALRNAKVALDGIINGANQQTTQQVLDLLKANGNPALAQQVTQIVQQASNLEQALLQKYGTTVAGEIANSILKAIDTGLTIGLGALAPATVGAAADQLQPYFADAEATRTEL